MKKDSEDSGSDEHVDVNMVSEDSESEEIADVIRIQELSQEIVSVNLANEQLKRVLRELELEKQRLYKVKIKEQTKNNSGFIQPLENFDIQDKMPPQDFPATHKDWPDSPKASPIREPKSFSHTSFEILDFPSVQAGSSKQSDVTSSQTEANLHETIDDINNSSTLNTSQNTSDNTIQSAITGAKFEAQRSSTKQSDVASSQSVTSRSETIADVNYSSILKTSQNTFDYATQSARTGAKFEAQQSSSKQSDVTSSQSVTNRSETIADINYSSILNTSRNTSDNATQSARTGAKFEAQQSSTDSEENYEGKGKGAVNPKYRYKKRSKPETKNMEIASQETPVKSSKACGSTGQKTFQSQSPIIDVTRISPAVKRKELASDEGCSGSTSNDTDDVKVAKKLKFEAGNLSSTLSTLSFRKDYESHYSSHNTDKSKTDQSLNVNEQLRLPSSRGLSSYQSSSEESFNFSENEYKEIKIPPPLPSRRKNVTRLEREDSIISRRSSVASLQRQQSFPFSEKERRERKLSTLSSISEDLTYGEKESAIISRRFSVTSLQRQESSQSTASFCVPTSDRAESSLASISDDAMFRDIDSPLPVINDELPLNEIEEPSLPLGEIHESFLTNVSDLSELIATTTNERYDPSQNIAQSQIDRSHNESEQLSLPSTSGLSKMASNAACSKDTSHIGGKSDVIYRKGKQPSLTSSDDEVTDKKGKQSSLTSSSDDAASGETEPSATTSVGDETCSCSEEISHSNSSNDISEESTQSTQKLGESFLTNVTDLSELIANASDEGSPSEAEGS